MAYLPWILDVVLLVLLVMKGLQLAEAESEIARLKDQLQRAQGGQLSLTGSSSGPAPTPSLDAGNWQLEARSLVQQGKKIDAIKLCRERTGLGLKEAKDAVEAL